MRNIIFVNAIVYKLLYGTYFRIGFIDISLCFISGKHFDYPFNMYLNRIKYKQLLSGLASTLVLVRAFMTGPYTYGTFSPESFPGIRPELSVTTRSKKKFFWGRLKPHLIRVKRGIKIYFDGSMTIFKWGGASRSPLVTLML